MRVPWFGRRVEIIVSVGRQYLVARSRGHVEKTLPDRGREVFDRAPPPAGSQADSRRAILAVALSGQTQEAGHGRRKLEPLVAAAEVVRDREVDEIGLNGYQLSSNAAEHLLGGERVHLAQTYTGFALGLADEACLVGEGA